MIIIVPHSAKFLHKRVLGAAMQYVQAHQEVALNLLTDQVLHCRILSPQTRVRLSIGSVKT